MTEWGHLSDGVTSYKCLIVIISVNFNVVIFWTNNSIMASSGTVKWLISFSVSFFFATLTLLDSTSEPSSENFSLFSKMMVHSYRLLSVGYLCSNFVSSWFHVSEYFFLFLHIEVFGSFADFLLYSLIVSWFLLHIPSHNLPMLRK